ncbi:VENN motif pre-toxin domain-containing protein [Pantoea eucrina]|uniref:VENN motif pre-toxin domain-containing protein n=1 Tax=Pantoea eucrina TaxID=472693 RepID=A0ABS1Z546_9GAMM|nr:VENN motif pre-toxin domain-containing protein [Pantoea eucrina]
MAQAVTGAAAPYLAEVIHNQTLNADGSVNVQANLMAHAVVGAVTAYAAGNSALSGAAMGEYIAQQMYPGTDRSDLTETQRQTISALGTLAAGLAGGVAGDSTAGVVAGAQAGRNAVENNALGAMAGSDLGFWLGKTPDATTEDKAKLAGDIAKGNAIVSAELAGTVGLGVLPKGAQITAVIGGGANTIIQYVVNGEVNYTDALIASWVGAATSNTGLLGTVGWNAAGGATSNYIKGDDPLSGAIISGGSAGIGYGLGQAIKGPLDKVNNPNWKNWEWVDMGMGVSKPILLDPRPAVIGNIISSGSTEGIGQGGPKAVSSSKEGAK